MKKIDFDNLTPQQHEFKEAFVEARIMQKGEIARRENVWDMFERIYKEA